MTPAEGGGWWAEYISPAISGLKELLGLAALPGAALFGGGLFNAWQQRRRERAERDKQTAADRRTDQEKRDAAFAARFDRLDAQSREYLQRVEAERDRAVKRADDAEARADEAEREHWRYVLWVQAHEHELGNARHVADRACAEAKLPVPEWRGVPRPRLPGDPP